LSSKSFRTKSKRVSQPSLCRSKDDLSAELKALDYDGYGQIQYKTESSIWGKEHLPFALQFFHRGYLYMDRVTINLVENGQVSPVACLLQKMAGPQYSPVFLKRMTLTLI